MLSKVKNFFSGLGYAYFNNKYPNMKDLFFSNKPIIAYYGFLGDENFGDEWVYESAINLFDECCLLPIQNHSTLSVFLIKKVFNNRIKGIIIGGGTLIGIRFYFENYFRKLFSKKIPIYFHGTGVHAVKLNSSMWNLFLDEDYYGGLRGKISSKNAFNFSEKKHRYIGDAAFSMFENMDYSGDSKKIIINIGTHKDYIGSTKVREELKKFVTYLKENNYSIYFLPMHVNDIFYARKLKEGIPEIKILNIPKSYDEAIMNFKDATFALGERLHFSVLALLSGVPMRSINYHQKHMDMLGSIDCDNLGIKPENFTFESVLLDFLKRENYDKAKVFNNLKVLKDNQLITKQDFIESLKVKNDLGVNL